MRSSIALAAAERIARVGDLLPVLERGALIVAPEFGARVERGPIGERLGEAARLPVGGAAHQVLRDVEAERHRQFLLLDGGEVEIRRRRDAALGQRDASSRSAASCQCRTLCPGMNSVGTIAAANSLNTGWPSRPSRNSISGMNTGTSRASARRKSTVICSMSGSRRHSGSVDSTSVAPSLRAEHRFDLLGRRGGDDRLLGLGARRIDHRLADDAEAHAFERPGLPDPPRCGSHSACSAPTRAAPS